MDTWKNASMLGTVSICSANDFVVRAALREARDAQFPIVIEATCNQVNQFGGYTGLRPHDFTDLIYNLCSQEECPLDLISFGGDHLGPNPWKHLPASEAMKNAEQLIVDYVEAGFTKLHLDTSMCCRDDLPILTPEVVASRSARLAFAAEKVAGSARNKLGYIIGTEVPPPGGANHHINQVKVTSVSDVHTTLDAHRKEFIDLDLEDSFNRVVGIVVQPGVEFGNVNVLEYNESKTSELTDFIHSKSKLVYEAHSTDFQSEDSLRKLVTNGFRILKVGPELTYAVREALYTLDDFASEKFTDYGPRQLYHIMHRLMLQYPQYWAAYYDPKNDNFDHLLHYSYSDRIRYYWNQEKATRAIKNLFFRLDQKKHFFPYLKDYSTSEKIPESSDEFVIDHVRTKIKKYISACNV